MSPDISQSPSVPECLTPACATLWATATSSATSTPGAAWPSLTPPSSPSPTAAPGWGRWTWGSATWRTTDWDSWLGSSPTFASCLCGAAAWWETRACWPWPGDVATSSTSTWWTARSHSRPSTSPPGSWGNVISSPPSSHRTEAGSEQYLWPHSSSSSYMAVT